MGRDVLLELWRYLEKMTPALQSHDYHLSHGMHPKSHVTTKCIVAVRAKKKELKKWRFSGSRRQQWHTEVINSHDHPIKWSYECHLNNAGVPDTYFVKHRSKRK
ncbi:hypothetical protein, unlikely [Trypanosoma brucei gambiense DAL972]|uniref:Uncharacterized protein n=1 Tax=Trypanosoma brucei gambiense (strain MHOM/CI/86/DAL972) TaxID=679716 RepID=D0A4B7_TRYB9|nr:hypothetical protein, unlikely [Trypanosoma brucei gambiense DAL972]CBH16111.1 hypothetical protein, unlikely [Trypanosoma brucei gambiense DAL972]|eukprot:XP_011778375.1 hypothetical protein, unlikely [Trypanosoma brucei gambiense DAL972]